MAKELALIGCGNMGTAMLKGIVGSGLVAAQDVTVADESETSQQRLADELGCQGTCDNSEAVAGAKSIIIAVKPQYLDGVVKAFAPSVDKDAVIISIAAGVSLERLEGLLGADHKIVRVMPNLAAMVGVRNGGRSGRVDERPVSEWKRDRGGARARSRAVLRFWQS